MAAGRLAEAEQKFRDVTASGGSSIYASMAKMGSSPRWSGKASSTTRSRHSLRCQAIATGPCRSTAS